MEEKLKELEAKVRELQAKVQQMEKQINDLSNGSFGSGVYLDGVSDYNKEFIIAKKEGK